MNCLVAVFVYDALLIINMYTFKTIYSIAQEE